MVLETKQKLEGLERSKQQKVKPDPHSVLMALPEDAQSWSPLRKGRQLKKQLYFWSRQKVS